MTVQSENKVRRIQSNGGGGKDRKKTRRQEIRLDFRQKLVDFYMTAWKG